MEPHEEWRPVVGFVEFEVSNYGRVRRCAPHKLVDRWPVGRIFKTSALRYERVSLRVGGKRRSALMHRLVAEAFIGPAPSPRHEINHRDGNKLNNRADNLEWVTRSANIRHADLLGLRSRAYPTGEDWHRVHPKRS